MAIHKKKLLIIAQI